MIRKSWLGITLVIGLVAGCDTGPVDTNQSAGGDEGKMGGAAAPKGGGMPGGSMGGTGTGMPPGYPKPDNATPSSVGDKDAPKASAPGEAKEKETAAPGEAKPAEPKPEGEKNEGDAKKDEEAKADDVALSNDEIAEIKKLPEADQAAALAQKVCPVGVDEDTKLANHLGSMGKPEKVEIKGQTVFICCKGCLEDLKADPDKYLAKLKK